jgi:hypothetical protein
MIMPGGFWSRHSWKFLLFLTVLVGLLGARDLIFGIDAVQAYLLAVTGLTAEEIRATSEPLATLIDVITRLFGLQEILLSLLGAAILLIPFRRGARWAWYAMWTFPLLGAALALTWLMIERQPNAPLPPPAWSGWVFFGLFAALLWASGGAFRSSQDGARPSGGVNGDEARLRGG